MGGKLRANKQPTTKILKFRKINIIKAKTSPVSLILLAVYRLPRVYLVNINVQ